LASFINTSIVAKAKSHTFLKPTKPWSETARPHPLATRLSRFVTPNLKITPKPEDKIANTIYSPRCEIADEDTTQPIHLNLSAGAQCLVLAGAGGWKNRSAAIHYYNLASGETTRNGFMSSTYINSGLADIAYWTAISDSRKLIFAADDARIKSFAWGDVTTNFDDPLPTHTMKSGVASGPLALLGDSRLVRAGRGFASVWNLDELPTHASRT
jgi:hypothetical protein